MFLVYFLGYLSRLPVAAMASVELDPRPARGPVFFFLFPGVVRDGYLRVDEASRRRKRYRVNLLAQNLPHLSRQRPGDAPATQLGQDTGPFDPILDSAQPPAASQRP